MYSGNKIIALCIAKADTPRNYEFIEALNKCCIKNGFRLLIYHACSDLYYNSRGEEGDKAVFELMDFDIIDAVVVFEEAFMGKDVLGEIVRRATACNVPTFSVGVKVGEAISFVFDYEVGFEQIVRHIVEYHNAKNTCFIAGRKGEAHSERRIESYKRVLAENQMAFDESRLFYGDYWWQPTTNSVEAIMASGNIPDAIICANDTMAITTCEVLKKHGMRVPEDIIVTGFDGIREAKCCMPSITTAKCSLERAAEEILKVVAHIFAGKKAEKCYRIPYRIDIGHSCGCEDKLEPLNMGEMLKKSQDILYRFQDDERAFHEMAEGVMECNSPHELCKHMAKHHFLGTTVVLNKECFDETVNPTTAYREKPFDEAMTLFYQADVKSDEMLKPIARKEVIPQLDRILKETDAPIVLSALSCYGIPMGYICFSFEASYENYTRILQYVMVFNNAIGNYRSIKYLRYTAESFEYISRQDFMTGLCNRKGFYNRLPGLVAEAERKNSEILVATIDIDGLKNINDMYGHEEGDYAIKVASDAVKAVPYVDKICGRFGGDELVVCAICEREAEEDAFKESIFEYLKAINEGNPKPYPVSVSIGVYIAKARNYDFEAALKISDDKMYIMKIGHPDRRKK